MVLPAELESRKKSPEKEMSPTKTILSIHPWPQLLIHFVIRTSCGHLFSLFFLGNWLLNLLFFYKIYIYIYTHTYEKH